MQHLISFSTLLYGKFICIKTLMYTGKKTKHLKKNQISKISLLIIIQLEF